MIGNSPAFPEPWVEQTILEEANSLLADTNLTGLSLRWLTGKRVELVVTPVASRAGEKQRSILVTVVAHGVAVDALSGWHVGLAESCGTTRSCRIDQLGQACLQVPPGSFRLVLRSDHTPTDARLAPQRNHERVTPSLVAVGIAAFLTAVFTAWRGAAHLTGTGLSTASLLGIAFFAGAMVAVVGVFWGERVLAQSIDWRVGWSQDPTVRVGIWLALAGAWTFVAGLDQPGEGVVGKEWMMMLGLVLGVVGYYAGGPSDLRPAYTAGNGVRRRAMHRAIFGVALMALVAMLVGTAMFFRIASPLENRVATYGMSLGTLQGSFAALACALSLGRPHQGYRLRAWRPMPPVERPHPNPRFQFARFAIWWCGGACAVYAATHAFLALRLASAVPLVIGQVGLVATLLLVASNCLQPVGCYHRLLSWIRGPVLPSAPAADT